ncbi:MAG: prepilin-type N-terminal cleavage/methylation domain-containing protein [Planctomycetota bacterium]
MTLSRRSPGFTLIEVVVVVTILVLLAGVLVPIVSNELSKARTARAQTDMKAVGDAYSRYYAHTGIWPSNGTWNPNLTQNEDLVGLPCLYTNVFNKAGWAGPYLNTGIRSGSTWSVAVISNSIVRGMADPWGRPYRVYVFAKNGSMGVGGGIVIVCNGENGTLNSSTAQLANGEAAGDDVVQVVTRRL